ncbi:hypothetical protein [Streptacidiphilus jiangxiensis]|uniref:Uncharacterized protein n=1 Tax=Streptacidiphilus jiangxiensis TaxID=235985 RepID=A0A1H7W0Z9_STRJI|nr:hypothetical protein [Streptacidiphilus jiangxiensis]SEM15262.1 hypothetical protein SAMN05414137_119145 [Streptacidiphilus jiangxiensis]
MTVFHCTTCATALTNDLAELPRLPAFPEFDGRVQADGLRRAPSTVPAGYFAVQPEPWGAPFAPTDDCVAAYPGGPCMTDPDGDGFLVSAGPRDTVVIHPDDAPELRPDPDYRDAGCCGLRGTEGMNRFCPGCGAEVGTQVSECYTPYELHLDPGRVRRTA